MVGRVRRLGESTFMNRRNTFFLLLTAFVLQPADLPAQSSPAALVAHEWGTFTSLQNEAGEAVGGINTDDEPVPQFVHRLSDLLLQSPTQVPVIFYQGAPLCHPGVTLRLETPVLYFHPSRAQLAVKHFSVTATFRGGWLTEFYPSADANAPGVSDHTSEFGPLRSSTVSTLAWRDLAVGGEASGPATTEHVWTAPRAVRAAAVRTSDGETEHFLFYRGVGHIDAPIAVSRDAHAETLVLSSQLPPEIPDHDSLEVKSLWLVDIRSSGRLAFRTVGAVTLAAGQRILTRISSHFAPGDYDEANREKLKASLKDALVAEGLFDDEAQALLETWELSYFKSSGTRLFFLVPRAWTDYYLPLNISVPAEITRVMVGRIELVTSEQRSSLRQIAQTSADDIIRDAHRLHTDFYSRVAVKLGPEESREIAEGRRPLTAYGIVAPRSYELYLGLGRFRNALILEEARKRGTPSLDKFISAYGLQGYITSDAGSRDPAAR
jgi:hypothetical protein